MRRKWLVDSSLLVLLTLLVYWQVHDFEFVNFDDPEYITDNPRILSALSYENVVWAFTTTYFSNWHPFTWLSYLLDAQIYGRDAGGYHLTNLVLHTANVLLLFAALRQMTDDRPKSAFVAALFAVHPLHVESVAWVSERKDVLSTFFGILAIIAYVRYVRRPKRLWYLAAWIAFACSLLSKQMFVTLPFVLLLLDYWPLRRMLPATSGKTDGGDTTAMVQRGNAATWAEGEAAPRFPPKPIGWLLVEKIPFFVLSALFCVVAFWVQQAGGATSTSLPLEVRFENALLAYGVYLRRAVWPVDLAVFYPHPGEDISSIAVAASAVFLVVLTVAAIVQRHKRPYLLVGWLWYVGMLVPVIGIVQIGAQQMADRYTYIPLVGVYISATWFVASLMRRRRWQRRVLTGLAVIVLAALMIVARRQTRYWQNSIALFERALAVTEQNDVAHQLVGKTFATQKRFDAAIKHYRIALNIDPESAVAHQLLGQALSDQHRTDEAIEHYRIALWIDPESAPAHDLLGNGLAEQQRLDEAIKHYRIALGIDSKYAQAHHNLGSALCRLQRFDEGIEHFRIAVGLEPTVALGHNNLGAALLQQQRFGEAIEHFRIALGIDPEHAEAHHNLGNALCRQQRFDEGIEHYRKALSIDPTNAQSHNNLGSALLQQQRIDEAIEHYRRALDINPAYAQARHNLAAALSAKGLANENE